MSIVSLFSRFFILLLDYIWKNVFKFLNGVRKFSLIEDSHESHRKYLYFEERSNTIIVI